MNTETLSPFSTDLVFTPVINFAMQQNHVPVVKQLIINNLTDTDYENLFVEISFEPDFAIAWKGRLDTLRALESFTFGAIPINVSSKFLAELTERLCARLILKIYSSDVVLLEQVADIDLLAYDQWNGAGSVPELIAAFITPNHPEISTIIRNASALMEKWTGDPSFNAYQSRNPDRVKKQMAAIYEAIVSLNLIYCAVPASFEETGQRIRLTDAIIAQKLANCLDLSLFYAACLEAIGINPLIVMIKGHAFVGAWLIDESFPDAVNDDASLITKRAADGINEIEVVESTCMNSGNHPPFDEAVRSADNKLLDNASFQLFIDVKRARFAGVRPLPLRIPGANGWEIMEHAAITTMSQVPGDITLDIKPIYTDKIAITKQQLWERKLLDLTLRNTLLNTRMTKAVIQFITINAGKIEDELADGKEFHVLAKPSDWSNSLRDAGIYQALNSSDPIADLVTHELSHQRLRTYLTESELNFNLTNLFRSSRLSLEENGANTLYVGIGLLKWYETTMSERPRFAPVIMIPVEIIRRSAQKGYVIRSREEETILNITLLEMIRQDFGISIGGLEILPKDEHGVDVRKILNIIRNAVMSLPRWDVEDQALLGNFSFNKFILWNDIHNNSAKLSQNKVVASLISGKLQLPPLNTIENMEPDPGGLAIPINTDSSQLKAIISSGQNESFVLHGPPGTGKSQTITNIIANALFAGKKVLFVSAKKAALEVVQKRLKAIGIGDFCLELHSNKSKKSDVLTQLKNATELTLKEDTEDFLATAERLAIVRNELKVYVEALHRKQSFGYSLFNLFDNYANLSLTEKLVLFDRESIKGITGPKIQIWDDLAAEYEIAARIISHPAKHPLRALKLKEYNQQLKTEAVSTLENCLETIQQYEKSIRIIIDIFNFEAVHSSQYLSEIAGAFLQLPDSPASFLTCDPFEQTLAQAIGVAEHGKKRDSLRTAILAICNKNVLSFPAETALAVWEIADTKWFLPKLLKQRAIINSLTASSPGASFFKEEIPALLHKIIDYQAEQQFIDKASFLPTLSGFLWNDGDVNWDSLIQICKAYNQINNAAGNLVGLENLKAWRLKFSTRFSEGSGAYVRRYEKELRKFIELSGQLKIYEDKLKSVLGAEIADLKSDCNLWLNSINLLKDWFTYLNAKRNLVDKGLISIINTYEDNEIYSENLVDSYKKGLFKALANQIIESDTALSSFQGQLFEVKIKRFREINERFEKITREELHSRLVAKIPSFTKEAAHSSEIGLLQRTLRNNGRAMPIRKLFDQIPNLLFRLTPCMLMSPISVAQYFDASAPKFDLVVFDEASQMPTCEAVGAIARGNNVIVVGDPKQMPPTSFFSTNNFDEEHVEQEDLESILDDCLALSMPSHHLQWHYRSKHESLIAFSNAMYYDNKLFTFPSPDDLATKVKLIKVKGFYDRGKTKQNRFEAKAVVDYIIYRLSNPQFNKRSLGVVTFSSVQQSLIEDLLTEVFMLRPDLEKLAYESDEPLFVKNLENVQGDERDIILFSIGYGPDETGKLGLNFGPINREGGWRRLNVAVSRARYEMQVFSTLRADQIDLNRSNSEGVAGLKAFLAYAEKGKQALPDNLIARSATGTGLENVIAAAIRKHGYKVNTNIGCSAYKIDIGIVHPDYPNQYILAVLCDGKIYKAAKTLGDREIIQPGVLLGLGWNILKIWSVEWWDNPEKVLQDILQAIHKAEKGIQIELKARPEEVVTENIPFALVEVRKISVVTCYYEIANLEIVPGTVPEDFFLLSNREKIRSQIINVLKIEAPISRNLLSKRVLLSWGIGRMGSRITAHFDGVFRDMKLQQTSANNNVIYWQEGQQPEHYAIYRVPPNEILKRDADDLPPHEIANGIREILKNQISLTKNDLIKEASKLFGYARIGNNVESAMQVGIKIAILKGFAVIENDRITICD